MLAAGKSLRRTTSRFGRLVIPHCLRCFHYSSVLSEKTVTKKKYSELPKFHVLPDGTQAVPLGDYRLAMNQSALGSYDASPSQNTSHVDSEISTDDTGVEAPVKAKRTRKKSNESIDVEEAPSKPVRKVRARTPKPSVSDPSSGEDHTPRTPLAGEIRQNLDRFPHCILLTKVGGFYESYFDQAIEVARELNIKLASRKWDGRRVPMCGFPTVHLDKHLQKLVQEGKRFVAMCEEFPTVGEFGAKEITRKVARVITPGTLVDESFIAVNENNFLLAVSPSSTSDEVGMEQDCPVGLAWIDVSTGEFFSKTSSYLSFRDDLARITAQEIVLEAKFEEDAAHPIRQIIAEERNILSYITSASVESVPTAGSDTVVYTDSSTGDDIVDFMTEAKTVSHVAYTLHETSAIALLTEYMKRQLLDYMPTLSQPNREFTDDRMQIDAHTIKALEIKEALREGGVRGTLLNVVKRTKTSSGSRLLSRWLCSPSTSVTEINARQSLVALFHARPHFRADLLSIISDVEDAGRIVQRFALGRGDSSDLFAINTTIQLWGALSKQIADEKVLEQRERPVFDGEEWASLDLLMSKMADLEHLSMCIDAALQPADSAKEESSEPDQMLALTSSESPAGWKYGNSKWYIKPQFSPELETLHQQLEDLLTKRQHLEIDLQHRLSASSLTLRTSPGMGMHVHLGKAKRQQAGIASDPSFIPIAESGSTRCYFNQEWAKLGGDILTVTTNLIKAEKEAFDILRAEVIANAAQLKRNARILDELDVTLAFAHLAEEMQYVRPTLTNDNSYRVEQGRHATVELGLMMSGRVFTPNSVVLTPESQVYLLTGPNMAGKSTLLRQTALISILAQTGSFIPADAGEIGIVDKVFSRVGASDDLFKDRSTFMVEMLETAAILQRATPRSLVIMDEVGRGTTVKDGLAIAFATIHHLVTASRCRALFATHFHELAEMLQYNEANHGGQGPFDNVSFFCTDVDETDDGHFAYSYRVRPGVNRNSHGLKVAQLAGMPASVITVAQNALAGFNSRRETESDLGVISQAALIGYDGSPGQLIPSS